MVDLANLPDTTSPSEFISIVEELLSSEPAPEGASPEKAQITLVGSDGGTWTMGFDDGRLKLEAGEADAPPVHVTMTVDDWRAMLFGRVREAVQAVVDVPTTLDPKDLAKLYRSADKVEQIKGFSGDIQLVIEDEGAAYAATITLGGGTPNLDAPTTKVVSKIDDFAQIAGGKIQPQMAFFQGQLRLEGDMNLVMQLFSVLAS